MPQKSHCRPSRFLECLYKDDYENDNDRILARWDNGLEEVGPLKARSEMERGARV